MNMLSKILMISLLAGFVSDGQVLAMDVDGASGSGSVVVAAARSIVPDCPYTARRASGSLSNPRSQAKAPKLRKKRGNDWDDDGLPYEQGVHCDEQDTPEPVTKRRTHEGHNFRQGVAQQNPYMEVLTAMQSFSTTFVGEVAQYNLFSQDSFDEAGNLRAQGSFGPYNAASMFIFNGLSEIFNDDVSVEDMNSYFMENYESLGNAFGTMRDALVQAGTELNAGELVAGCGDVVDRAISALDNLSQKIAALHDVLQQDGADISILAVMRAYAKRAAEQWVAVADSAEEDDEF